MIQRLLEQPSRAQDLLHTSAARQLVDQLIEIPHLPRQRIFDLLDAVAADHARNKRGVGIERSALEEGLERRFFFDQFLEFLAVEAGQPLDDAVQFFLGAAFFLDFGEVVGIDRGEGHRGDAGVVGVGGVHGVTAFLFSPN